MVSSSAPGSLSSSLNAGIIKDIYFSAGSEILGQGTCDKWEKCFQQNKYFHNHFHILAR